MNPEENIIEEKIPLKDENGEVIADNHYPKEESDEK